MAQQTPEQIIEGQRQDWNPCRWRLGEVGSDSSDEYQMAFLESPARGRCPVAAGMQVLDLGSGTGLRGASWGSNRWTTRECYWNRPCGTDACCCATQGHAVGLANVTFRAGDVTALPV